MGRVLASEKQSQTLSAVSLSSAYFGLGGPSLEETRSQFGGLALKTDSHRTRKHFEGAAEARTHESSGRHLQTPFTRPAQSTTGESQTVKASRQVSNATGHALSVMRRAAGLRPGLCLAPLHHALLGSRPPERPAQRRAESGVRDQGAASDLLTYSAQTRCKVARS